MYFGKFTIQNFRSFEDIQTLVFGLPQADKLGSGITYIVGENNSGKTTVLEGLRFHDKNKIRTSERQIGKDKDPEFLLYDNNGDLKKKVALIRNESSTLIENPTLTIQDQLEFVPSKRYWGADSNSADSMKNVLDNSTKDSPKQQSGMQIQSLLKDIESDQTKYVKFIKLVQQVIPEFTKFAIGYEEREYIEYVSSNGTKHRTDFLGDGVISLIRILAHLFDDTTRGLVIDEPELSLHPLAKKRLLKIIAQCATKRQIIISTHSPYFVDREYIKNGAILNRVTKTGDVQSKIHTLKNYETYKNLINGANRQQPYLMDIVSKEIFFQDNIVFVEGQEDIGLLKNNFSDYEINFFGYGVRGKDAFDLALQLSQDIGVIKAVAILDLGESETKIKNELETKYPNYKIIQRDKEDIRDKEPYQAKAKEGYFDKNGILKKENETYFNNKIKEIKDYFEPQPTEINQIVAAEENGMIEGNMAK